MLQFDRCCVLLRTLFVLSFAILGAGPALAQVVADAGDPLTLECSTSGGAFATLDGLGSTVNGLSAAQNPDTSFLWQATGIVFNDDTSPTPNAKFPLGKTTVTLTVTFTDPNTQLPTSAQDTVDVTVGDTTAPTLALVPKPAILWPPNHKLVNVEVVVVAADVCDPHPVVVLSSLTSSEPDNGLGDGDTSADIQQAAVGTDDREFLLRAERSGPGSGRTYSAVYHVTDASGNSTNGLATIVVPHDMGDAKSAKSSKAAKAAAKAADKAAKAADKAAKLAAKNAKQALKAAQGD